MGHAFLAYATNYLLDIENAIFLDAGARLGRKPCQPEKQRSLAHRKQQAHGAPPGLFNNIGA